MKKIVLLLKNLNIPYLIGPSKNVGIGVVGINCPFCAENGLSSDKSFHLGFFSEGNFSCWRCNESGNLYKAISKITSIDYSTFQEMYKQVNRNEDSEIAKAIIRHNLSTVPPIPREAVDIKLCVDSISLNNWLKRRKFDIENLASYTVKFCSYGEYDNYLIIPIYNGGGEYVGFQARDVTDQQKSKYDFPANFKANNYLYGFNNISEFGSAYNYILITEGVTNVWRIGLPSIATFGKALSDKQRNLLIKSKYDLIFAWDFDAKFNIQKEISWWREYGVSCKAIYLPKGYDPDKFIVDFGMEKFGNLVRNAI